MKHINKLALLQLAGGSIDKEDGVTLRTPSELNGVITWSHFGTPERAADFWMEKYGTKHLFYPQMEELDDTGFTFKKLSHGPWAIFLNSDRYGDHAVFESLSRAMDEAALLKCPFNRTNLEALLESTTCKVQPTGTGEWYWLNGAGTASINFGGYMKALTAWYFAKGMEHSCHDELLEAQNEGFEFHYIAVSGKWCWTRESEKPYGKYDSLSEAIADAMTAAVANDYPGLVIHRLGFKSGAFDLHIGIIDKEIQSPVFACEQAVIDWYESTRAAAELTEPAAEPVNPAKPECVVRREAIEECHRLLRDSGLTNAAATLREALL